MDSIIEKKESWRRYNSPDLGLRSRIDVVQMAGYTVADRQYKVNRDGFDSILVGYVESGRGILVQGGTDTELETGTVFWIDCRMNHSYRTQEEDWCFSWVHFFGSHAGALLDIISDRAGVWGSVGEHHPVAREIKRIGRAIREVPPGRSRDLLFARMLLRILSAFLPEEGLQEDLPEEIDRSVHWIHQNYGEPVRLEDMARVAGMSRFHFLRRFKELLGETPGNYLIRVRIEKSKALLEQGDLPVEAIAREMGFGSSGSYIKHFRLRENTTPLQFRIASCGKR